MSPQEALFKNREQAVCCIVGAWSSSELHLSHLVPPLFTSVQPLYNMTYLDDIVSQGLQYTSCLVRSFLEALKNNCDTKLKLMDLSGFPTGMLCTGSLAIPILLLLLFVVTCIALYCEVEVIVFTSVYRYCFVLCSGGDNFSLDGTDICLYCVVEVIVFHLSVLILLCIV